MACLPLAVATAFPLQFSQRQQPVGQTRQLFWVLGAASKGQEGQAAAAVLCLADRQAGHGGGRGPEPQARPSGVASLLICKMRVTWRLHLRLLRGLNAQTLCKTLRMATHGLNFSRSRFERRRQGGPCGRDKAVDSSALPVGSRAPAGEGERREVLVHVHLPLESPGLIQGPPGVGTGHQAPGPVHQPSPSGPSRGRRADAWAPLRTSTGA